MSGTCEDKTVKGDSDEMVIYVSNLAADISRTPALQTGDASAPYTNLARAIYASRSIAAPLSENADGSMVTVRIALLAGEHFLIEEEIDWIAGNLDLFITFSNRYCKC